MYIYISAAISLDGFIDDSSPERLMLSSEEDFAEVKRLRAGFDAILVGAETIRRDNPSLVIKEEALRQERIEAGMSPDIIKVIVSTTGELDPASRFFTEGDGRKIVVTGNHITAESLICRLSQAGIRSLFVEGGSSILTMFLSSGRADYLRLAIAPFFVGEQGTKRFVNPAGFPINKNRRAYLRRQSSLDDTVVAEYSLKATAEDYERLENAIELSLLSPPADGAYSVGAIIVTKEGKIFTGYSRETAANNHAEEEAIFKAHNEDATLKGATIYSSMEPCSTRRSKERSCSAWIIAEGISRVVFAAREPSHFVACEGESILCNAGVEVVYLHDLEQKALEANKHILK